MNFEENSSRREYVEFLKSHPFHPDQRRDLNLSEMEKQDRPDLAWEQDYLRTLDPALKRPAPERLINAREKMNNYFASQNGARTGTVEFPWIERGPNNVGGRTRALMWDPNDTGGTKVWAGGVTGGLWYNNDIYNEEVKWVNVDDFWVNITITCIANDPNNTNVFYVGTGEVYTGSSRGAGIWKSEDGGSTWSQITATEDFYYVNDIIVRDESGSSVIYAAIDSRYYEGAFHNTATSGLKRSTDGGSSWTAVLPDIPGETINYVASDLELSANNRIWAGTRAINYGLTDRGGARILYSDDGTNWTTAYSTSVTNGRGRVELACAPSNANVVYGIIENNSVVHEIVKTTNNGSNWSPVSEPADADTGIPNTDFSRGQAGYDLILAVNPSDENGVYAGGIDLFKTEDAGSNWGQISKWSNNNNLANLDISLVHADQHQIVFKPGSSTDALFGNDGGVYISTDMDATSPTINSRNKNYNVTQFYAGAMHPDEGVDYYLAGSQDNGTQQFRKSGLGDTDEASGGDGAFTFIDQDVPEIQVSSYVYNSYFLSTDDGQNFSYFVQDQSTGSFINPADYDNNLGILYSNAGSTSIGRWTSVRTGSPSRNDLSVSFGGSSTALTVSPFTTSSSTLYVGTSDGEVYKITNADGAASTNSIFNSSTLGSVSCVELGASEDEIMVTFFNYGITSVWYTSDGGLNWSSKEGDLPDMPIRWALFNPNDRNEVILATELGIWRTEDFDSSSPNWVPSNKGLANVRVDMLQIRASDHEVAAFTFGRGTFTSKGFSEVNKKKADFTASATEVLNGNSTSFSDLSTGNPVSWSWAFEDGTPSTSTDQNPTVAYSGGNGSYDVTLTVTYSNGTTSSKTSERMITIMPIADLPNVTPYKRSSWDDIIPIYNVAASSSNTTEGLNTEITTSDNVYFSVMLGSTGDINVEEAFLVDIYLDDSYLTSLSKTYSSGSPFQVGFITWNFNLDAGVLSQGSHSIRMEIDPNNVLSETDDSDNSYTRSFYVNSTTSSAIVWDGSVWSNTTGPASSSEDVVFSGNYYFKNSSSPTISQMDVNDVTILPDVKVTVQETSFFSVSGNLENNGTLVIEAENTLELQGDVINNGSIKVESGGSLATYAAQSFSGNDVIIQRNTTHSDGRYSFIGSPVEPDASITGGDLGSFVYKYNETTSYGSNGGLNRWENASSEELVPGKGYTQSNQLRIVFAGVPNAGTITYSGTYTDDTDNANEGWNLISNPYATAINVADFLTKNDNTSGSVYIWDDNGSDTGRGTNQDYIVANGSMASATSAGGNSRYNFHLGSTQGFFVKLKDNMDTDIVFEEDMRSVGQNADANFFREAVLPIARINLTDSKGLFKQAVIGLAEDANNDELNRTYDAQCFNASADFGLFTMKAGRSLALNGMPQDWENIQLQLNAKEAGDYQISIELEGYDGSLYLRDNLTEEVTNLTNKAYSFSTESGIYTDRFVLISSPLDVLNVDQENVKVFAFDKTLYIQQPPNEDRVYKLFNMDGRELLTRLVSSKTEINLSHLSVGVYLVFDGTRTHKILLK